MKVTGELNMDLFNTGIFWLFVKNYVDNINKKSLLQHTPSTNNMISKNTDRYRTYIRANIKPMTYCFVVSYFFFIKKFI